MKIRHEAAIEDVTTQREVSFVLLADHARHRGPHAVEELRITWSDQAGHAFQAVFDGKEVFEFLRGTGMEDRI